MNLNLKDKWVIVYLPTGEIIPYPEQKRNKGYFLSKKKAVNFLLNNIAVCIKNNFNDFGESNIFFIAYPDISLMKKDTNYKASLEKVKVPSHLIEIIRLAYV